MGALTRPSRRASTATWESYVRALVYHRYLCDPRLTLLLNEGAQGPLALSWGSTRLDIAVEPIEGGRSVVCLAHVTRGSHLTPTLLRELLSANARTPFGGFAITPSGDVVFRRAVEAETLDADELYHAIEFVAKAADDMDDVIVQRFGGDTARDLRLRARARPVTEPPVNRILRRLQQRGITVEDYWRADAGEAWDVVAHQMGRGFADLEKLVSAIEWAGANGGGVAYTHGASTSHPSWQAVLRFTGLLRSLGISNSPRVAGPRVRFEIATSAPTRGFFSGQWLERYVRLTADAAIQSVGGSPERIVNAKIRCADNRPREIDAFYWLGGRRFLWIEAKSGGLDNVGRYPELGDALGLAPTERLLVVAERSPGIRRNLEGLYSMKVAHISELPHVLAALV